MRALPSPPPWKSRISTVGATGTNGKTSTVAWIAKALAAESRPVPRTTTVGTFLDDELVTDLARDYDGFVALMKRGLDAGGRFAAVEYTSEALALGFAKAWAADVAVFTNLSHDHLDSHGTPEHYLASKAQLFMHLPPGGAAVLNAADPASALLREVIPAGVRVVSYGVRSRGEIAQPVELLAETIETGWDGTRVVCARTGLGESLPESIAIRAVGDVFVENVLGALLGAVLAGVPGDRAAAAIADAPPPPGRFEVIARDPFVVVDYAHTPDALARTLATARSLAGAAKLTVVFGAGGLRDREKRAPMGKAASVADRVVLTSDNPRTEDPAAIASAIRRGIAPGPAVDVELDRRAAIALALGGASTGDVIVIAGRGHETEQTVGTERLAFSDVEVARELLAAR